MPRRKSIGDHRTEMLPGRPSFPDGASKHSKPWESSNWRPSVSRIMRSNMGMCCWVFGNEAKSSRPANTTAGSVTYPIRLACCRSQPAMRKRPGASISRRRVGKRRPSEDAVTRRLPSGLNAALCTQNVCPDSAASARLGEMLYLSKAQSSQSLPISPTPTASPRNSNER